MHIYGHLGKERRKQRGLVQNEGRPFEKCGSKFNSIHVIVRYVIYAPCQFHVNSLLRISIKFKQCTGFTPMPLNSSKLLLQ